MATGIEETLAYGIGKAFVIALVKPVTESALTGLKSLSRATIEIFSNRISDYVLQQTEKHGCLSTIVFGHQKKLEDLYIPLTVIPCEKKEQEGGGILMDSLNPDFLPKNKRILITDTAGMGKSTISKFLFLQCLKSNYAIPIFIELRHLSASVDVISYIDKQLNPPSIVDGEEKISKKQIERIFRKSKIICFFDGYDEIPLQQREIVTRDVKNLIDRFHHLTFVITSRPETGLLAFPAFKQFSIRPLEKEESYELIRKYDERGHRSDQLIAALERPEYRSVHQFLRNPLLTSLLYRSFEYKQNIPLKKHVFYRQVFDALFDWHDASKDGYNTREKKSALDIDSFHRLLRVIGFVSVLKGEIEGDTDTVLTWIRRAKEVCNFTALPESNFLDDLVKAVPVFIKEGDSYRWSHKSLAEYFAAQYFCTEGKSQFSKVFNTLLERRETSRFSNVLDQMYDIDPMTFREFCILPMAKEFGVFTKTSFQKLDPSITAEDIRLRKACTFDATIVFLPRIDLKNFKELNELVFNLKIDDSNIVTERDDIRIVFAGDSESKRTLMILAIPGPYRTILEILEEKKDPLVLRKALISWPETKGSIGIYSPKEAELLGDGSGDIYNSPEAFSKVTKLISGLGPVIDVDKLLNFEQTFNDSKKISSLADDLLNEIVAKKAS